MSSRRELRGWRRQGLSRLGTLGCFALSACSGDAVELGDGPLDDESQNESSDDANVTRVELEGIACESGIDCQGGRCARCFLETCVCDSSDQVMPVGCLGRDAWWAAPPVVNDDGSAAAFSVCLDNDGTCRSFYWSAESGRREIPARNGESVADIGGDGQVMLLPQDSDSAMVYRVGEDLTPTGLRSSTALFSGDGTVVGIIDSTTSDQIFLARWSRARDIETLATFPNDLQLDDHPLPALHDVTPDASVIVGVYQRLQGDRLNLQPFRWSETEGLVLGLDELPSAATGAALLAVSRDGKSFAGVTFVDYSYAQSVFRWTAAGGFSTLGPATWNPLAEERVVVMNADGTVVAGLLDRGDRGVYPFRWTEASGSVPLVQNAGYFSPPFISADGRIVIGAAFEWLEGGSLYQPAPWRFEFHGGGYGGTTDLSSDANIAVGTGKCGGVDTVYRRVLDPF